MTWLNGLTLDQVPNPSKIVQVLKSLGKPVAVRIVFDEGMQAKDYLDEVKAIATVPGIMIMGELCDSEAMPNYSLTEYKARAQTYLKVLGPYVHIWEIGNEINGDWLGSNPGGKALAAHSIFKAAGKKTALTGYYNCKCEDKNGPMANWLKNNIDSKLKQEVDYFFISYYEDDCENRVVANSEWTSVFNQMGVMFPKAQLGIGECGTTKKTKKSEYMKRYYSMSIPNTRFIGGFFWWYGYQDLIASTTLVNTFKGMMR